MYYIIFHSMIFLYSTNFLIVLNISLKKKKEHQLAPVSSTFADKKM